MTASPEAATRHTVRRVDPKGRAVELEVLARGIGPLILMLPSLGRPATDFDAIAPTVAAAGYRVLCPQPRGIGASKGPLDDITLHDWSADAAAVIEHERAGPAFAVGHAFGNRVSRLLATVRGEIVEAVCLIAANVGKDPSPPDVRVSIRASANPDLPDAERLKALQHVFFAPGNDASGWLKNWHPNVLQAQRVAGDLTPRTQDYAGGGKPILYLQPSHDPLAHVEDAEIFKRELGDRVTVEVIPNASHAAVAEAPAFIARALIAYADTLWQGRR